MTSDNGRVASSKGQDCLACRLIGSAGMFGISVYVFMEAFKHAKKTNRLFLNTLGTGRPTYNQSVFFFYLLKNIYTICLGLKVRDIKLLFILINC